jgi:anti-sigma factor RsiW
MSEPQAGAPPKEIRCEQCRELLSDYVDRELSAEERAAVERHLGSCQKCGTESVRLMGLKKIVQRWDGVKGSGEFRAAVMEKMIRESQQMASAPFTEEAARASQRKLALESGEGKTLPPVWILAAAAGLAVLAYLLVRFLTAGGLTG